MNLAPRLSRRGFTLVEIMIVVLVVGILSTMAMVVIGRIKDRALRTAVENNLRELYRAKEFYFAENGGRSIVTIPNLAGQNYMRKSLAIQIVTGNSYEGRNGWHYYMNLNPGEPVYVYNGPEVHGSGQPTGERIYFPAAP